MYIQFKHGFIEADRWDGTPLPVPAHQAAALAAESGPDGYHAVIVVRARECDTIGSVTRLVSDRRVLVLQSPPDWDYEWRCYLSAEEWKCTLAEVAYNVDYRNFKAWSRRSSVGREKLAHDIWHAANEALRSDH